MFWSFRVVWIRPDLTEVDISNRIIDSDAIESGIGDPSELFAELLGDWQLTLDDQDGFFRGELNPLNANLREVNYHVDAFRDGVRIFRGSLLVDSVQFDGHEETVVMTFLGPLRLLADADAGRIKREFDVELSTEAREGDDTLTVSSAGAPFRPGDLIRLGEDSTFEYRVMGYDPTVPSVRIDGVIPEGEVVPRGTAVNVLTPFPRDRSIKTVVEQLYEAAGIPNHDVQFSGLLANFPFLSPFNTFRGEGQPRGFMAADGPPATALRVSYDADIREATTFDSGFSVVTSPASSSGTHGNWFSPYRIGFDPLTPPLWSGVILGQADNFRWTSTNPAGQTPPAGTYKLEVSRYTGWKTTGIDNGVMFELRAEAEVDAVTVNLPPPRPTLIPDWTNSTSNFRVEIRKYVTANGGASWLSDLTFGSSGVYTLASINNPSDTPMFLGGDVDPLRRYLDPEVDWSITGSPNLGPDGVLFVTVQEAPGQNPKIRRLDYDAGANTITAQPVVHFNAGSCTLMVLELGLGQPSAVLVWRQLVDSGLNSSAAIIRDNVTWSAGPGTYSQASVFAARGLGDRGLLFRALAWNGKEGLEAQVAGLFRGTAGAGWVVLDVSADQISVEREEVISEEYEWASEFERYLITRSPVPQFHLSDSDFLTTWRVDLPQGPVVVWVGISFGKYFVLGNVFTGFIRYYDFEGLSILEAVHECAFLVNANPRVITQDSAIPPFSGDGRPYGIFKSRDLIPLSVKVLSDFSGAAPVDVVQNPAGDALLVECSHERKWVHNFDHVRVIGRDVEAEAGNPDLRQDGVEITSRLLETTGLAVVIASNLMANFGGISGFSTFPVFPLGGTYSGPFGPFELRYQVAAYDSLGFPIALSNEFAFPNVVASPGPFDVNLNWVTVLGADTFRLFRTFSSLPTTSPPWDRVGLKAIRPGTETTGSDGGQMTNANTGLLPPGAQISVTPLRQAADIQVLDDGTEYRAGDVVIFPDLYRQTQPATPTNPAGGPLRWVIERVNDDPNEPTIGLSVYQKDLVI